MAQQETQSEIVDFVVACSERRSGRPRSWLQRRRQRADVSAGPYEAIRELAAAVLADPAGQWVRDVFGLAETAIASANPVVVDFVGFGLFEDLQNISSHSGGATAEMVRQLLGPHSRNVWAEVEQLWARVAAAPGFASKMTDERLGHVQDSGLRSFMLANFRRLPSGTYVNLADVLAYETEQGDRPRSRR